ncbi:MAG: hypothetical protein AAF702_28170 [Chloroflexota bacterium]
MNTDNKIVGSNNVQVRTAVKILLEYIMENKDSLLQAMKRRDKNEDGSSEESATATQDSESSESSSS